VDKSETSGLTISAQPIQEVTPGREVLKEAQQLLGGASVDASRISQFYAQFDARFDSDDDWGWDGEDAEDTPGQPVMVDQEVTSGQQFESLVMNPNLDPPSDDFETVGKEIVQKGIENSLIISKSSKEVEREEEEEEKEKERKEEVNYVPGTVGVTNDATVNLILKEARQLLGGETVDASRITQFYAQFEDDDAHEDVDVNKLSEEVSSRAPRHVTKADAGPPEDAAQPDFDASKTDASPPSPSVSSEDSAEKVLAMFTSKIYDAHDVHVHRNDVDDLSKIGVFASLGSGGQTPTTDQESPRHFKFRPITDADNDAPNDIDVTSFKDAPTTDPLNKAPNYLINFIRERKDTSCSDTSVSERSDTSDYETRERKDTSNSAASPTLHQHLTIQDLANLGVHVYGSKDGVPFTSEDLSTSEDLLLTSEDLSTSEDLPMTSTDLPMTSSNLPFRSDNPPLTPRALLPNSDSPELHQHMTIQDLESLGVYVYGSKDGVPLTSEDLPLTSTDLPLTARALLPSDQPTSVDFKTKTKPDLEVASSPVNAGTSAGFTWADWLAQATKKLESLSDDVKASHEPGDVKGQVLKVGGKSLDVEALTRSCRGLGVDVEVATRGAREKPELGSNSDEEREKTLTPDKKREKTLTPDKKREKTLTLTLTAPGTEDQLNGEEYRIFSLPFYYSTDLNLTSADQLLADQILGKIM